MKGKCAIFTFFKKIIWEIEKLKDLQSLGQATANGWGFNLLILHGWQEPSTIVSQGVREQEAIIDIFIERK